ncbi:hypothetical protein Q4610_03205 [Sphingobium sp. HBC34]|uniref:Uncharacterized protein n=1 Tax=Sphingobium cyanobacteriorum TaxID=3063954 RepID=A0ABT8ZHM6_9SPHN|nr:hypothetical protein [Sphingobium sp. HBC34]MDO7834044.1 hypothetical protein [Sphingobium sp. HBC34]
MGESADKSAPSPSHTAHAGLTGGSSPETFYWRGISSNCLAQARDKKKADHETGLKVFRRGCLKGTVFLSDRLDFRKCEGREGSCTMRNQGQLPIAAVMARHPATLFFRFAQPGLKQISGLGL